MGGHRTGMPTAQPAARGPLAARQIFLKNITFILVLIQFFALLLRSYALRTTRILNAIVRDFAVFSNCSRNFQFSIACYSKFQIAICARDQKLQFKFA